MTGEARLMSGIILITVPTIQYGGYFLLTSLMDACGRRYPSRASALVRSNRSATRGDSYFDGILLFRASADRD